MTAPTLTEFLLARIAEEEAAARTLRQLPRWTMAHDLPNAPPLIVEHIMRYDPTRVLAECEAKRRIVKRCSFFLDGTEMDPVGVEQLLGDLAAVYADHPDYRDEWKP